MSEQTTGKVSWTTSELRRFDRLSMKLSSQRQMDRIEARLEMQRFVKEHGEEKCNAMFEHLTKRKPRS